MFKLILILYIIEMLMKHLRRSHNEQLYERWFLAYEHCYFIIKTSIKLAGFFLMTQLSNHFYPGFFFTQIIV